MCEKATEVQELRHVGDPFEEGDYFENGDMPRSICLASHDGEYGPPEKDCVSNWLPRLDQLQEMISAEFRTLFDFYKKMLSYGDVYFYYTMNHVYELSGISSMEQLWLLIVMLEKYNKTWNGEDWVGTRGQ